MEQGKGYMLGCDYDVCEAEAEGNAEKQLVGGNQKNLPFR
jgi:hypothetical protein